MLGCQCSGQRSLRKQEEKRKKKQRENREEEDEVEKRLQKLQWKWSEKVGLWWESAVTNHRSLVEHRSCGACGRGRASL